MENIKNILEMCKTAREKGNCVTVKYDGCTLDLTHQESTSYKMVANITVYDINDNAITLIFDYLKGLIK